MHGRMMQGRRLLHCMMGGTTSRRQTISRGLLTWTSTLPIVAPHGVDSAGRLASTSTLAAAAAAAKVATEQAAQQTARDAAAEDAAATADTATRCKREMIPIHHPEHTITGKILGAKSAGLLLELFDKEEQRFGWYTAVRVVNNMAKRRFSVDKGDDRLHRLLDLLATAAEQDSMGSRARLGRPTDDVSSARDSLKKLGLTETTRAFTALQGLLDYEDSLGMLQDDDDDHQGKPHY